MSRSESMVRTRKLNPDLPRSPIPFDAIDNLTEYKMSEILKHSKVVHQRLGILRNREDNWDDEDSKAPTDLTVDHAEDVITTLLSSAIRFNDNWFNPFITSDLDGDITAVWRKDERELHLQIGEKSVEYFKVWGINIHTEMDVDFLTNEDYLTIWEWLISGE